MGNQQDGVTCFTTLWLWVGGGVREGTVLLHGFWVLPGTCPISSQFTHSPCMTGAFPGVTLVLNPRVGGFVYVLKPCGPFKWHLLKIRQFLPLPQPLLVFTVRSYGDLSSQYWNPGQCGLAWGWELLAPKVFLLIFIHHT